jgi:hypothetical protein
MDSIHGILCSSVVRIDYGYFDWHIRMCHYSTNDNMLNIGLYYVRCH